MKDNYNPRKPYKKKSKRLRWIIALEVVVLLVLFGGYWIFFVKPDKPNNTQKNNNTTTQDNSGDTDNTASAQEPDNQKTPEEIAAAEEQERLKKEDQDRKDLIAKADRMVLSYDYDGAIELIKSYKGTEGGYEVYPVLTAAIQKYETAKSSLVLYGGSYNSVTQINHIFFHSLIADNSKAFDGDYRTTGYNMYMTTISEFKKIMQKMYDDGYVLVSIHDITVQEKQPDGTTKFVEGKVYLPQGKKPFVLSQDDVNYYEYMDGDGFASRFVLDENGKPTLEMKQDDGSYITGPFDMVPIVDEFVEEHPDFSYKGHKGIIALTGYEGALGYRTNDPTSPTYEQDKETVKKIAEALKADGWEFASHSWGHKNDQTITYDHLVRDTNRWLDEVGTLIGPTDVYIFPFGIDIETTMGHYKSDKFHFLKSVGFNYFCGVYDQPWMHIKDDYVRMTRRPLDGQAMIQFPERVTDLFDPSEVLDPDRPPRDW